MKSHWWSLIFLLMSIKAEADEGSTSTPSSGTVKNKVQIFEGKPQSTPSRDSSDARDREKEPSKLLSSVLEKRKYFEQEIAKQTNALPQKKTQGEAGLSTRPLPSNRKDKGNELRNALGQAQSNFPTRPLKPTAQTNQPFNTDNSDTLPWQESTILPIIPELKLSNDLLRTIKTQAWKSGPSNSINASAIFLMLKETGLISPRVAMSDISITRLKNAPGSFTSFIFSVKVPKEQSTTGSDESYIVKGVNWLYKTVKYRAQQTPLSELQSLEYLRHSVLSRLNFEKNKNLPVLGLPVKSFWFYMPELPNTSRARFTTLPPQKRIELQMEDRLKESQDYLETGRYNRNAEKELEESDEESSEDTSSSSYISDSEGSSYASSEESESSESSSFSSSEESGSTIDSRKAPAPRKPLTLTPLTKEYITIVRTVSGTSLNRYIKEYTPEDSQEIQEIFFQVGRSLGEFHYLVARPQEKEALKRADFDNFKTTTHGDFHPGNIFWDSTLNRVGFIDLATMAEAHRKPKPFWHDIFRFYYFAKYIEWYNGKRTLNQFNELMEKFILGYCEAYPEEVRRDLMVYLSQELASWTKTVLLVYQSLKQGSFDIDFPEYSKRDTTNPENDYDPVIFAQEVYGRSLYKINRAQEDLMMDSFLKK